MTDGNQDSTKSQAESVNGTTKTFTEIDGAKKYYTYYIVSVDKLGNKSTEIKRKVGVKTTINIPEGFVEVPGVSIKGDETWTPSSEVFMGGRALEIKGFYMSDHEVTRAEYKEVMGSLPSGMAKAYDKDGNELTEDNAGKNPVNGISWYDAIVYCNRLSINENLTPCYKIGGSTNPTDWGAVPRLSNAPTISTWNAATCDFDADGYGLYDMSGNVHELCWDWKETISSTTPASGPATGSASGSRRCARGSAWNYTASDNNAQVAYRNYQYPYLRDYGYYGFRVVRAAQ